MSNPFINLELNKELNKELIWITLINQGYTNFTKNFVKSMEKANVSFTLIIFCIDKESLEAFSDCESCICLDANLFLKSNLVSNLTKWEEWDYKRIVFAKLDAILYTLEQTKELGVKNVGYIDTDIVLLSDPSSIVLNELNNNPDILILSQCDEVGLCSNKFNCRNICSGVIVFRNTELLNKLIFAYTDEDIKRFYSDQHYLCAKLKTLNITLLTIDKMIFLNGTYPGIIDGKPTTLPTQACLVHFNYLIGLDKCEKMKLQNMWYL
jgi:hypothetical protein